MADITETNELNYEPVEIVAPVFRFAIREDLINSNFNFLPTKAHVEDTGWDVRAAEKFVLRAGQYAKIPLGFRIFAPSGWWIECRPRSSTFGKKQLHCLYGVIDEGYEGECFFVCQYIPDISAMGQDLVINFGDAIGQFIPVRRQEMVVQEITNKDYDSSCKARNAKRGIGALGSTDGKK